MTVSLTRIRISLLLISIHMLLRLVVSSLPGLGSMAGCAVEIDGTFRSIVKSTGADGVSCAKMEGNPDQCTAARTPLPPLRRCRRRHHRNAYVENLLCAHEIR